MNLTTRLGSREIVTHHFLDALSGVPVVAATPEARLLDLGTGAGLPGLPLKIALGGLRLVLLEGVRKKVVFCQEVIRETSLASAEAVWGRAEELKRDPRHAGRYDWVVSRAVGQAADLVALGRPLLAPGGRLLLYKGKPSLEELAGLDRVCARRAMRWHSRPVAVPHLEASRTLIIVEPAA
jgi:16S rRNA (guanine527-N7)-methyltransferase